MRNFIATMAAGGLVLAAAADGHAAIMTFQFTGTVTASSVAGVSPGNTITGFYTFDTSVADTFPLSGSGIYPQNGTAAGFQAGGFSLLTNFPTDGTPGIYVQDNQFGFDTYSVNVGSDFSLSLFDADQNQITSEAILTSAPDVSQFESTQFFYNGGAIMGLLDSIVVGPPNVFAVPAPAAWGLLLGGLALLGAAGRRRKA